MPAGLQTMPLSPLNQADFASVVVVGGRPIPLGASAAIQGEATIARPARAPEQPLRRSGLAQHPFHASVEFGRIVFRP
jgi:hypothetical protein